MRVKRAAVNPQLRSVDRYNRRFYERCWRAASLLAMPGVRTPADAQGLQVEIGCGLRPRLPLAAALFVDVSPTACAKLRRAGARVIRASIDALPFASGGVSQSVPAPIGNNKGIRPPVEPLRAATIAATPTPTWVVNHPGGDRL